MFCLICSFLVLMQSPLTRFEDENLLWKAGDSLQMFFSKLSIFCNRKSHTLTNKTLNNRFAITSPTGIRKPQTTQDLLVPLYTHNQNSSCWSFLSPTWHCKQVHLLSLQTSNLIYAYLITEHIFNICQSSWKFSLAYNIVDELCPQKFQNEFW